MANPALTGNEQVFVVPVAPNGQLSPLQVPYTTGQIAALAGSNPNAPIAVGASTTASNAGAIYLLSAATGSVLTLPNSTGSGASYKVCVSTTVTSNAHKILVARTADNMQGNVLTEDAGTVTGWNAAVAATYNSLQLNGTTTGGFQGDWFDIRDIAVNTWEVIGFTKSTGTAATPFSTADS